MENKYEFVDETKTVFGGIVLHRIKALRSFGDVKAGDLGGFIEKETNLSHVGDCWIYDNAEVYGKAYVYDNALIRNDAIICGRANVFGNGHVCDNAIIGDNAFIFGDANVFGNAHVYDNSRVYGYAKASGNSRVYGDARAFGKAYVYGDANVFGNAKVYSDAIICGNANISKTSDYMVIGPIGSRNGYTTFYKTDNNTIYVKCGCFNASIDEFETRVREVHGNNKHAINYNKAIDLAKTMINDE
jgi:carbonic anhydrase/acetyltransferase-like protein (isoleucine patch superfamily)